MADFLALDWENKGINGFEAQVSKGKVRLRQAFYLGMAVRSEVSGRHEGRQRSRNANSMPPNARNSKATG